MLPSRKKPEREGRRWLESSRLRIYNNFEGCGWVQPILSSGDARRDVGGRTLLGTWNVAPRPRHYRPATRFATADQLPPGTHLRFLWTREISLPTPISIRKCGLHSISRPHCFSSPLQSRREIGGRPILPRRVSDHSGSYLAIENNASLSTCKNTRPLNSTFYRGVTAAAYLSQYVLFITC
jgi:hypothetical protein